MQTDVPGIKKKKRNKQMEWVINKEIIEFFPELEKDLKKF